MNNLNTTDNGKTTNVDAGPQMNEEQMKAATEQKKRESKSSRPSQSQQRKAKGNAKRSELSKSRNVGVKPPQVTLCLDDNRLDVVYSVQQNGHTYKEVMPVADGQFIKSVGSLINPIVKMTNAILHGEDLRDLNQLYARDDQGKPTKEPLKTKDGQVQYRPNSIDAARTYWSAIAQNAVVRDALVQLDKAIEAAQQDENIKLIKSSVTKDERNEGAHIDL
jgi:hypothetical protein